jgi:hypothetical protein
MKKLTALLFFIFYLNADILPFEFSSCIAIKTNKDSSIGLDDNFIELKKYSCSRKTNKIIFIGITKSLPGVLKIRTKANTPDFLLKHVWIKRHLTAIYIDKKSKTGTLTIKLTKENALKIIFYTTYYREIIHLARKLDFEKIKKEIEKEKLKEAL